MTLSIMALSVKIETYHNVAEPKKLSKMKLNMITFSLTDY
jgi:hypothetical protein